jgi:hypothetical protein
MTRAMALSTTRSGRGRYSTCCSHVGLNAIGWDGGSKAPNWMPKSSRFPSSPLDGTVRPTWPQAPTYRRRPERSDARWARYYVIICISPVGCMCGICSVMPTQTHQLRLAPGCPVMVNAVFLGKVATILRGCGYATIYHVGVPANNAFILMVMAALAVVVSCVSFLATTPIIVWQANQPRLNVCH